MNSQLINATQMAQANNVRVNNFTQIDATKSYIDELSSITGIPAMVLCQTCSDSTGVKSTWMHPLLALNFGRWIHPSFAIWCDTHIKTLIEKGSTTLVELTPLTPMEQLLIIVQNGIEQEKKLAAVFSN